VGQDLTRFFNKLGGAANVSNPGAYKDQTAGYYTGGNLFARTQVHTSQLATIQMPDYRAGCGGIDMFMGAFSHISSENLIQALKAIGSNVGSYALLLAIETMSPQIKNILTELNDLAQKINQSNINSCEIAATTLGAVWPKSDAAQGQLCKMIGSDHKYGGFSDYAAARQGCGADGKREGVLQAGSADPRFKSMLGTEFNLAWKAIQENAFLRGNRALAEFFMSLSGTILSHKNAEGAYTLQTKVSLADKEALLSAILYGGEVSIYRCRDPEKCLQVLEAPLVIDRAHSLVAQVREVLLSIQSKIYDDLPLSEAEIAFLNGTRLPFYKILNVATAYRRGGAPIDVLDYAELGAIDILFQYLSEILDVIQESVNHLEISQVDDAQITKFQKALEAARSRVTQRRSASFKQIEQVISIVSKTELLEKNLMVKAGALSAGGGA
jgi:conjugative transfer pilus assembly protein TraH